MLTRDEAKQLVLLRLKDTKGIFIAEERTIEREFGWLFVLTVSETIATKRSEAMPTRLIIVNKHVKQVIESSINYTPERLLEVYEKLLALSRATAANWCMTVPALPWSGFHKWRLAQKIKKMGLYEIR